MRGSLPVRVCWSGVPLCCPCWGKHARALPPPYAPGRPRAFCHACSIASAPATYLLTCGECSPLQQCVAITHSIVLSLGVLLPLCLLEQLERRARRHFAARQRLQRQQAQQLERRRQQRERQEQQEQEHRLAQVLQQALAEEAEEDAAERWEAAGGSLERHLLLAGQPVEAILSTQFLASCLAWLGANALAKWPT